MKSLLLTLLGSSSVEELGDYVCALNKVKQALDKACDEGKLSQKEAEMVLSNWLTGQ